MSSKLKIRDWDLGGNNVEAFYFECKRTRAMAIDPQVSVERRRMWELVALGLKDIPAREQKAFGRTTEESQGVFFFLPQCADAVDILSVRAIAVVLDEVEPEWVARVKEAENYADDPEVLAAWSELPVEVVLAATGDWRTWGLTKVL